MVLSAICPLELSTSAQYLLTILLCCRYFCCFLYTYRYRYTDVQNNQHNTACSPPLSFVSVYSLLAGQRENAQFVSPLNPVLSSAIFLLILTFRHPVKCSLKAPNYASHFFFCLSSFSQMIWLIIAFSFLKLARVYIFVCMCVFNTL